LKVVLIDADKKTVIKHAMKTGPCARYYENICNKEELYETL